MGDTIQFVDSIASSPTVLLDLNDLDTVGSGFNVRVFSAPPPRLRRSVSQNSMRDGAYVSASNYDNRVVTLDLEFRASSQDNLATEWQTLVRIVDGQTSILKYQPTGATSPVFFKVFRSDFAGVTDRLGAAAMRDATLELYCEPTAYGLRETVSVGTVNNDPAAGSNGCYFDATGIKGDVLADMVFVDTGTVTDGGTILAVRQHGTPTDLPVFVQCESMTAGTDTANPGGGPNATYSGSGTNNYMETTFAGTPGLATRLTYTTATSATQTALTGTFRLFAVVARDGAAGSTITVQARYGLNTTATTTNDEITLSTGTARQIVDLGLVSWDSPVSTLRPVPYLELRASCSAAGGDDLWWDCIHLVPADEALFVYDNGGTSDDLVIDGETDTCYAAATGTSLFTGTTMTLSSGTRSGSIPRLYPNRTNRIFYIKYDQLDGSVERDTVKSRTGTVTVYYLPRYLHVRPATT